MIIAALAFVLSAQADVRLEGRLRERGTREVMRATNIYCIIEGHAPLKAVTDDNGRFVIEGVPEGSFHWVVNLSGYEKLDQEDEALAGIPPRELYVERASYQAYETTIYAKTERRDDRTKSLSAQQFNTPGSGGDPIKAVQNLPGVNRAGALGAAVIIEGSAPGDTRYSIDGHEVPIIFHFGGLSSVVTPEALERVDYLPAGYGPENGRANGGIVGVWTRAPKSDRSHGFGFVDLLYAGALMEGPAGGDTRYLVAARQSYIGPVLRLATKSNADFNLTVAPEFGDFTVVTDSRVTPIDTFRVVAIGSNDALGFLLTEPAKQDPSIRGTFEQSTSFFRLIPQVTHFHSWRTQSKWSLGIGKDWQRFDTGDNFFHQQSWNFSQRLDVERKMSDAWKAALGLDGKFAWTDVSFALPKFFSAGGVPNPIGVAETRIASESRQSGALALYLRNEIRAGERWTLLPGARVEWFRETHEAVAMPRLAVRFKPFDESLTLRTAGGLYSQPVQPQEIDPAYGNPAVTAPRAWHWTLGAEKDLRGGSASGLVLSGDLFYKYFENLVVPSTGYVERDGVFVAENYVNSGHGRAFGLETLTRWDAKPFTGWVSYTLSRSTRFNPSQPESLFSFDQTHVLTAIASYEMDGNWKPSARVRYVTGNPFTSVGGGLFDADNDVYVPTRGAYFAERMQPFFQVDLRVDKKWIYDRWILSAYVDIQNLGNRQNIEAIRYSFDYTKSEAITGIPTLITLGFKGEF